MSSRDAYRLLEGNTVEEGFAMADPSEGAPHWAKVLWPEARFTVPYLARAHLSWMDAQGLPVH